MSSPSINYVGTAGDPTTQGLGRLIGQYVKSPKLAALLAGIYGMAQDLEGLFQRLGRLLNVDDDIYDAQPNTYGAQADQLRIIGNLVGVTSVLPDGTVLADVDFRQLVRAKQYRNSAVANSPGLRRTLWWIFDPTNAQAMQGGSACSSTITLLTIDLGGLGVNVALIYPDGSPQPQPTDVQLALLRLTAGRSNLPYGLLARPDGVELGFQWQPTTNVYSLSRLNHNDPAESPMLTPNGCGWNVTTGVWAKAFK
jgi:hypothetical protein